MWPSGSAVRAVGFSPCGSIVAPASAAPPNSSASAAAKAAMRSRAVRVMCTRAPRYGAGVCGPELQDTPGGLSAHAPCWAVAANVNAYPAGTAGTCKVRDAWSRRCSRTTPPSGRCSTESAQRAKVLEGMVRAVAEKGFAAATVADAVRLARVSRGTFYALFDSKEACLAERLPAGLRGARGSAITAAVRDAADWREELRARPAHIPARRSRRTRSSRASTCSSGPRSRPSARRRCRRFIARYRKTFARSGRPVPPDDALFVLAVGHPRARLQLACAPDGA